MLAGAACTAKASLSSTESFWGALDCLSAAYPGLCADSSARGCQPGEAGCIQPLHLGRQPCRGGRQSSAAEASSTCWRHAQY